MTGLFSTTSLRSALKWIASWVSSPSLIGRRSDCSSFQSCYNRLPIRYQQLRCRAASRIYWDWRVNFAPRIHDWGDWTNPA